MTAVATYTAPGPSLLSAVRRVLGDADEALACVAFAQVRGVELLRKELSDVAARKSARVLVTTSFGATDPQLNLAWEALRSRGTLSNRELLDDLRVHRSSFVCALLARLPEIERVPGRDIVLRWTGGAPEPVNAGGDGKRMPSSER